MDNLTPIVLKRIISKELSFKLEDSNIGDNKSYPLSPVFTVEQSAVNEHDENNSESYQIDLKCSIFENTAPEERPFVVSVTMRGEFTVYDVDNRDRLLQYNAIAALMPFVRSALSMLTSLAGVASLQIPFINVNDMYKFQVDTTKNED